MTLPRATSLGWFIRVAISLAAVGCAVPSYRYAEVAVLRANAPDEAAKFASNDAQALASVLSRQFDDNPEFKLSAGNISNIQSALLSQPIEPKLISLLGLAYESSGDFKRANSAMYAANRASRRDIISSLYLIEGASESGDAKTALIYYDRLLSTHPEFYRVLFPILSSAIKYFEIRQELENYIISKRVWVPAFLNSAIEKSNIKDLEYLLIKLSSTSSRDDYTSIYARALHRVAVEEGAHDALAFARATVPGFTEQTLKNFNIETKTLDSRLGLLAWTWPQTEGLRVDIGDDNAVKVNIEPLAHGVAAMRDMLLEKGKNYELVQNINVENGDKFIDAKWIASCVLSSGVREFWDQRLPISTEKTSYRSVLFVPPDCNLVRLTLFIRGPEGQMPSVISIKSLGLSEMRN